ncbi:MAG: prolyl oligopeptidase family serine peptidase [Pirellulales bacterium]|nr:prolyl oligopeptidase family serine peptidase [Pirellulales bacterium]
MLRKERHLQFWPLRVRDGRLLVVRFVLGWVPVIWGSVTWGQGSREDFERSRTYSRRTENLVFRDSVQPHWFGEDQDRMWYQVQTGPAAHRYVLVDAATGSRSDAFDHQRLADLLSQQLQADFQADRLNLRSLTFDSDQQRCRFVAGGKKWVLQLPAGPLTPSDSPPGNPVAEGLTPQRRVVRSVSDSSDRTPIQFVNRLPEPLEYFWVMPDGNLRSYGRVDAESSQQLSTFAGHAWLLRTGRGEPVAAFVADSFSRQAVVDKNTPKPLPQQRGRGRSASRSGPLSPDQKWRVEFEDGNVVVVDLDSDQRRQVTDDASADNQYGGRVWWSPNAEAFVVMKTRAGTRRQISMVDSSPEASIHSRVVTIPYAKPGDRVDHPRPVLFGGEHFQPRMIDDATFPNPYQLTDVSWRQDGSSFSFLYNQRGHQILRWISVDAQTAQPRTVIDEVSETFICYSSKKYLLELEDTNEAIWMSERSGWNHLYLIDSASGQVKHPITSGDWVVRRVEHVDQQNRLIWLQVSGMDPDQDPYHRHLIRVDFDGGNLVRLTAGDGDHQWSYSPDRRFLIDTYSRVDLPPITDLRDANTGRLICHLESAEMSSLLETGWQPPQRFVSKGRDGKTDIYGIIVRPTHFDPQQRYPVLEAIYAGPHSAFVPKRFGRHSELYSMAELGFIVVKIDGMGTNHRSKAFHDVCWKNLGDSGFPDRIAWIRSAAEKHPEMDLSRVGIWGGSAGGQSAMRALIAHGDFYHAAVADCGCHDNRVDKIWWNEQWMGWPIASHYQQQSNVTQAHRLQGDLMLIWGELDRNVDPASTMQVVDALIRANKDFEQLIMPGVGHGAAGHPYARRRQADFFIRKLWNREPRQD